MHKVESAILDTFKRAPSSTHSTTDLVRAAFPHDYDEITGALHSLDGRTVRKGHYRKAQLHRKLLYHLNKLVEEGILATAGTKGKGEKQFRLAMDQGELIIQDRARTIVIAKPPQLVTAIDGYEHDGLIQKYRPASWLNKQNSVLIDAARHPETRTLLERLHRVLPSLNDTLALDHAEQLLARDDAHAVLATIKHLARDYDVGVNLLLSLDAEEGDDLLVTALERLLPDTAPLRFVLALTPRQLTRRRAVIERILGLFSTHRKKLTIKHAGLAPQPLLYGRAGPYTLSQDDWDDYQRRVAPLSDGCLVGQASLALDLSKLRAARTSATAIRDLALRAAHAFFDVDEERRKHYGSYYAGINQADPEATKAFQKTGRNYLRIWNYDWEEDVDLLLDLLASIREELDGFCSRQEVIFKSCGLPIRFRIALSTSFAKFDQNYFSERRYKRTEVNGLADLQSKEMRRYLGIRERLFKTLDQADRLRFFVSRRLPPEELARITRYLLSAYDLPSFTYDFHGKTGELKLTAFLEEPA